MDSTLSLHSVPAEEGLSSEFQAQQQPLSKTSIAQTHRNQVLICSGFEISEDSNNEASTTQDTGNSTILSVRDINSQSESRVSQIRSAEPFLSAQENGDPPPAEYKERKITPSSELMENSNPAASTFNMSQPLTPQPPEDSGSQSPASSSQERVSLGARLKQLRASTNNETAYASNSSQRRSQAPFESTFRIHREPMQPSPFGQPQPSRGLSDSFPARPANHIQPASLQPIPIQPMRNGPMLSQGQRPVPSSLHIQPQPQQRHDEHQPRMEMRPSETPVDIPAPVHTFQNGPHTPTRPSNLAFHQELTYSQKISTLTPIGLDENEYAISLAMNPRIRDQYISTIQYYSKLSRDLLEAEFPNEDLVQDVKRMIARVDRVTTHSDLDAHESQEQFSQALPEVEAKWADNCSYKFLFLNHLFHVIRPHGLHISIVARPGPLLDIIETYLKGRGIVYFRPGTALHSHPGDQRYNGCSCEVSIVPSGPAGMNLAMKPASLVIAFDGTFNVQDLQVQRMRVHPDLYHKMPVLHLLVYKSAEHIARCLPPDMDEAQRLKKIVSGMIETSHDVGMLLPEDMAITAVAEETAFFLIHMNGQPKRWMIPSVRPILLDLTDSSQESSTQDEPYWDADRAPPGQNSALKRVWVCSIGNETSFLPVESTNLQRILTQI